MYRTLVAGIVGGLLIGAGTGSASIHTLTAANLRSRPTTLPSSFIRTLPEGEAVEVLGDETVNGAHWLKVQAGADSGWIRADLVREEAAAATQPSSGAADPAHANPAEPAPAARGASDPRTMASGQENDASGAPHVGAPPHRPQSDTQRVSELLASGLEVRGAEAAMTVKAGGSASDSMPWPLKLLRDSQITFAALFLAFVLFRIERRLEEQLAPDTEKERHEAAIAHVDAALANEGIRREYDRLIGALYAIERLLMTNGNGKSALTYLTELVAAVNTTGDRRARLDTITAMRKKMLEVGMLPAFSRAFGGLGGYAFTDQLRDKVQAFLTASEATLEAMFEDMREPTKLCFDELGRRLVPDVLQGGTMGFLFSRRPDLLTAARAAAQSAAARGWTSRDIESVRQIVGRDLFSGAPVKYADRGPTAP